MTIMTAHRQITATFIFLSLLILPSLVLGQESELTLGDPPMHAQDKNQRPAVLFPHENHMDVLECLDCHHDYENGENVLDESDLEEESPAARCDSCHDFYSPSALRSVFHSQCIGCHRKARIKGEAAGPELCGECHRK